MIQQYYVCFIYSIYSLVSFQSYDSGFDAFHEITI